MEVCPTSILVPSAYLVHVNLDTAFSLSLDDSDADQ